MRDRFGSNVWFERVNDQGSWYSSENWSGLYCRGLWVAGVCKKKIVSPSPQCRVSRSIFVVMNDRVQGGGFVFGEGQVGGREVKGGSGVGDRCSVRGK